ncbi:ABC1-domain-containing protein [Dacryopinax primogenitus]|uniref:ABC1-domain-containing protein n=1 Tax=Dacryopinax primogenitus (strain DJM 731) TaxID=1858805 RepID=M5G816_DACPD|nr:ABC1-domain-containing protein [Dacryopinax primogenitus]EJU04280.1 ABC1-domain-containing protein [Dacryopinax primogenitus]
MFANHLAALARRTTAVAGPPRRYLTSSVPVCQWSTYAPIPRSAARCLARSTRRRPLVRANSTASDSSEAPKRPLWRQPPFIFLVLSLTGVTLYHTNKPFRHTLLAVQRCSIFGIAVAASIIDYKITLNSSYYTPEEMFDAYSRCHKRSALRVLQALKTNGGIYIKMGQHVSSIRLLPTEWTSTMRPLQDQCPSTPMKQVRALFLEDTGKTLEELFSSFDEEPVGVASLAQVHMAVDRETGRKVAVKIQHPHLEEFAQVDIKTTMFAIEWVKALFPNFEFSWLGEEMQENLPLEMDFSHEASNALRAIRDFSTETKTSLYIPDMLWANRRSMVMEYIEGARVDDLAFLAKHRINRNRVAQELSRIFSEMVYLKGFFHADPHPGNLLIRPARKGSKSPYNFEIVLLDHGLYFDLDDELRVNYARLWLTLITPNSKETRLDRRKYAKIVCNVGDDMYPLFESIITGRAGLAGSWDEEEDEAEKKRKKKRPGSVMDFLPASEEEMERMRRAIISREGLIADLFRLLRYMPSRRLLMILKLNDLTRNLDQALCTTHGDTRIFVIVARYCGLSVWQADVNAFRQRWAEQGCSFSLVRSLVKSWAKYHAVWNGLWLVEVAMDCRAKAVQVFVWVTNLSRGLDSACQAAAGVMT